MSRTVQSVQNEMWNQLRKTHCPVTIYLCNGVRLSRVVIVSFDMYAVTVRTGGETQLVCKSNIATVLPEMKRPPARSPFRRPEAPSHTQTSHAQAPHAPPSAAAPVVTIKRSPRRLSSLD